MIAEKSKIFLIIAKINRVKKFVPGRKKCAIKYPIRIYN